MSPRLPPLSADHSPFRNGESRHSPLEPTPGTVPNAPHASRIRRREIGRVAVPRLLPTRRLSASMTSCRTHPPPPLPPARGPPTLRRRPEKLPALGYVLVTPLAGGLLRSHDPPDCIGMEALPYDAGAGPRDVTYGRPAARLSGGLTHGQPLLEPVTEPQAQAEPAGSSHGRRSTGEREFGRCCLEVCDERCGAPRLPSSPRERRRCHSRRSPAGKRLPRPGSLCNAATWATTASRPSIG